MLYFNMECCSVSPVWKDKIISRADFCMIVVIETSNMDIEPFEHKVLLALNMFFYTGVFFIFRSTSY